MLVFLIVVPAHVVMKLLGRKGVIPPIFLYLIGRVCGLRVRTEGKVRKGAVLLSNHIGWLDIFALAGACRAIFVAQDGLAQNAVVKWLCLQNDTVFISRDRRGTVHLQVEQVRDAIGERPVTVFLEAGTGNGSELRPFRSSLLAAVEPLKHELPIQPVVLAFADAPFFAWYGDESGFDSAVKILSRKGRIDMTIRFLEPLEGEELSSRKTMASAAREEILDALPVEMGGRLA